VRFFFSFFAQEAVKNLILFAHFLMEERQRHVTLSPSQVLSMAHTQTGLTPNTTYTLSGWDRVSYPSALARIGVKNYGGSEIWVDNNSTGYTQESVTFTTGQTSTQASIYCSKPVNGNAAEFDDLDLVKATTASPIPNLTTNIGTPTGTIPFTLTGTAAKFATLSAVSSYPSAVPNQNLIFGGSGTQHTLTITPAPGQVGSATITLTVTDPIWGGSYTDGTSDTFTLDMSDWQGPQGYAGESVAASLPYFDAADGSSWNIPNYLYQYRFTLNNQKTVTSITLPSNGNVMLLALNLLL
jgi:hypothetical protein